MRKILNMKNLVFSKKFELFISLVILINCALIGIETYFSSQLISQVQTACLAIFVIEISMRFIVRDSTVSFFKDPWNNFDSFIVLISLIPEYIIGGSGYVVALRILRVFRILRLLRTSSEFQLIITVLFRSFRSLWYNTLFFMIFFYLFSIIGVTIFKIPNNSENEDMLKKYELFINESPNAPVNSPDPYGTLHESMFTLFRILTGEDWTDVRYNLITASQLGLIDVSKPVVTLYHVLWFCISAFLLLNLLIGAILNNYNVVREEMESKKIKEEN